MERSISNYLLYHYISSKAGVDAVRTVYLCPPSKEAASAEAAEQFAEKSGWKDAVEDLGAILVVLAAPNGWTAQNESLVQEVYAETQGKFMSRSGKSISGISGRLMCIEAGIYGVGYEDGAAFLGRTLIRYPNTFAAVALINGAPTNCVEDDSLSNHWFVKSVSADYARRNRDIPVQVWLFSENADAKEAAAFFARRNSSAEPRPTTVGGLPGTLWASENPAEQVLLFETNVLSERKLALLIVRECFSHVFRWKDGPDGKLLRVDSKEEFYKNPRYDHRVVTTSTGDYDYVVHIPNGMRKEDVKGLPLVFTVHGRGESAWISTTKNGWDALADETQEFVIVSPNSDGNVWFYERDKEAFVKILEDMLENYHLDASRVYLTGFSMGGMIVREVGVSYPHLFAAISPWNAPQGDTIAMEQSPNDPPAREPSKSMCAVMNGFLETGLSLPCAFVYGDNDRKAMADTNAFLETMLIANGCAVRKAPSEALGFVADEVWQGAADYPPCDGFSEGDRFTTYVFKDGNGDIKVTETIIKNIPHGAFFEESRATWNFFKRFKR